MAQIQPLFLDLLPAYVPFLVQCQDAAGAKTSPSVDNLIIYEEGGADATPDTAGITGSPFDPVQINSKTGLWGVWVAKSALTAGKIYIALWEMTVDGTAAAKAETYLAVNSSSFQANVDALSTGTALATVDGIVDAIKLKTDNLPADPAGVSDLPDVSGLSTFDPAADEVTTDAASRTASKADLSTLESRLTANRAGYLDKLNIGTPTLAHTGNADMFKATGFSTLTAGDVWTNANRSLTEPVETDAVSRNASQADLTDVLADLATVLSRLSAARAVYLDKLNVSGTLAHSMDASRYQANLAAVALEASVQSAVAVLDRLDGMLEAPGGVDRFLASALEEAPTGSGTGASAAEVWGYTSRSLTAAVETDSPSRTASQADLSTLESRLTATRAGLMDHLSKLNVSGELANVDNADLF